MSLEWTQEAPILLKGFDNPQRWMSRSHFRGPPILREAKAAAAGASGGAVTAPSWWFGDLSSSIF